MIMNTKLNTTGLDKIVYESPMTTLMDICTDGILCASGQTEMLSDDVDYWNN